MAYSVKQRHRAPAVTSPVPVDPTLPRACVVGAGSSGIAAVKALAQAGVPFDCFEQGSVVGGNWVLDNPLVVRLSRVQQRAAARRLRRR